jgi:hypothetical protein
MAEEKPEAKAEQNTKSALQSLIDAGEVEIDEELQNLGGMCIIGYPMPKPKNDPKENC